MTKQPFLDDCEFDVAVTGNPDLAAESATAQAASHTSRQTQGSGPPVSAAPCVLGSDSATTCRSSDPEVSLDFRNESDTSGCTFRVGIDWGDGSPEQTVNQPGGETGTTYLASHTYVQPGRYSIQAGGSVFSGKCTIASAAYQFVLTG